MSEQQHPLMTPEEVRAAFGAGSSTVNRWARSGKLASFLLPNGRDRRFFRAEVEALLRGEKLTPAEIDALRDQIAGGAS